MNAGWHSWVNLLERMIGSSWIVNSTKSNWVLDKIEFQRPLPTSRAVNCIRPRLVESYAGYQLSVIGRNALSIVLVSRPNTIEFARRWSEHHIAKLSRNLANIIIIIIIIAT